MNKAHQKTLLIHISIIAALVLLSVGAIVYGLFAIASLTSAATDKEGELQQQQAAQLEQYSYKDIIKNSTGDREKIAKYFLNKDQVVTYIETLENLATKTNVLLETTVSPGSLQDYELRINGTYSNVFRFISLLEQMPYYSKIRTVSLAKNSQVETSASSLWEAQLKVTLVGYLQ